MRTFRLLAFLTIAGLFCAQWKAVPVFGQTVRGTILGTVKDSTGAVLPRVNVSARSLETGVVRTATTDDLGVYHVSDVPAGAYQVEASISGFKTEVRSNITVTVGASVVVNFDLVLGQVEEKLDIVGGAPLVDTTSSAIGGLVNDVTIRELPLNGRDWLQLAVLQPGATFSPVQFQNDVARLPRGNGLAISVSGGRPTENVYRMDGLVINDFANASPGSALWVNLGVDAIREFSVLTDTYPAEYGRSSGGVINAITKSGGNDFHGTGFYFTRNSALDARNFFDKLIPPFRRHQFGGSFGGPIRREKTFFFVNYEGLREFKSLSFSSNTLSPNARNGILADPSDPTGTKTITVSIDSRIKPYLALYPFPNGPITRDTGKFIFGGGRTGNENYVVGKIDHTISDKTTLNATYRFDGSQVSTPDAFDQKLTSAQARHQDFILSLQHVFSPTLLNNVRGGFTRTWATDGFDISANTPLLTDPSLGFIPGRNVGEFNISGLNTFGGIGDTGADIVGYTAPQAYDDLSWTRGRHSFRTGFGIERLLDNVNPQTTPNGTWAFSNIQNMLIAKPSQFTGAVPGSDTVRGLRTTIFSAYLQDDFRYRPNLMLNLGLRYEMSTSINEVNGKIGNLRSLTDAAPTTGNPLFLNPTLGNLEPRLGMAWDPFKDGKTSVRAGFGIYDVLPLPYLFWNKSTHGLPFFKLAVVNNPPASEFPNNGLALIQNQLRVASVEFRPHRSYKMQWNLNIQRQLGRDISVMVGYVGSSSVHLPVGQNDADQVPLSLTTTLPNGQIQFPTTGTIQRINTNFSRIDDTLFYGHSTYHALQTSLLKRLSHGLSLQGTYTWSRSIDNGSTFFSQNETANSADPIYVFNPALNRGPSDFDTPHNAAINAVWQVPSPSSLTGARRFLLSGWEIGGIFTVQSGSPFNVGLTNDQGRTGTSTRNAAGGQRPNYTPGPNCTSLTTGDPSNYINMSCFSFPALGTLGNLGRNALRGPTLQDLDFSVFKNNRIWGEKLKMQFRAEIFNIFNHPNFGILTTTLFDGTGKLIPTAGQLQPPTATTSRQIQFGMKFIW